MARTTKDTIDEGLKKVESVPNSKRLKFAMLDPQELDKSETLEKSLINTVANIQRGGTVTRLAFESDPRKPNQWHSLYKRKEHLVPDQILKRIAIQDDLVAAIVIARCSHVSAFGRELQDRFATGFRIEPRRGIMENATQKQKDDLQARIVKASKIMATCGTLEGWEVDDRMSLATFLYQQTRNAIIFGRFATEILYYTDLDGSKKFHSFRPVDASTIYPAAPKPDQLDSVRKQALRKLQELKNEKLVPEKFENDEYTWVQVIQEQLIQAFTPDEMVVHNIFPVTDYELGGFPVTPIDTAINAIITHMNITTHNKLYFQNGRAARGMVIIKSNDVSQDTVQEIRNHFQASINNVNNSWRIPVFGIDPEDDVEWKPFEMQSGRDMEFQYLADTNARVILSAFQMSPEELPGYQHLSRGTNNQALSESNNEYKLEAARDVGIRPLLSQFQDFLNERILPLIDPLVAQLCTLKLYGLDADTAEKESTRIQQDMALHMTYDEIREKVEKGPIGPTFGGTYPLNPGIQGIHDKYLPVGVILERFFGIQGASKDPQWAYVRDPFWFNYQQLQLQQQQLQLQQQQMQQEAMAQQQQAQATQQAQQALGSEGEGGGDKKDGEKKEGGDSELSAGVDQLLQALGKSEADLPPQSRRLLAQHKATVKSIMDDWEKESQVTLQEVLKTAKKYKN